MFRTKLKALALGLGAAVVACGVGGLAAGRLKADGEPKDPAARPAVAPEKPPEADALRLKPPARIQPGDFLVVEVLEALPGRPITGERLVRPDGTISLGFYGDIPVAGLTRHEVKVKVIEHLRKSLNEENLGLSRIDWKSGKRVEIAPADSDSVFVEDDLNLYAAAILKRRRGDEEDKLDRILRAVETLHTPESRTDATAPKAARLADHERRLADVETKIDRLIRENRTSEAKD